MKRNESLSSLLKALFIVVLVWTPSLSFAGEAGPCVSPYHTIKGLLDWLQPDTYEPRKAARCVARAKGVNSEEAQELAEKIIQVLDGKGLFIDVTALPAEPGFKDDQGLSRYQLAPTEPQLYLEKRGDQWLWSQETLRTIPQMHDALFLYDINSVVRRLPGWARSTVLGIALWQLLALLGIIFLTLVCRVLVRFLVVGQARTVMKRFDIRWGDELLNGVSAPAGTLVGTSLLILVWPLLSFPVQLNRIVLTGLRALVALSLVWIFYRVVDLFTTWLTQKAGATESKLDDQLVPLIRRALKIFVISIGTVFILQSLDYDVAGLLAGLGIGGLAFALAAKDTIANLFGSATIFASRPFQIGDSITVGGVAGVVESVGFRSTRIRTFYDSLVTIPNATVADSVVDNKGRRHYRRFKTELGLTYDTTPAQIQAFVEGIRAIIRANPGSRKDSYEVHFHGFGASSLNILVYMFFEVSGWSEELKNRHNLLLEIMTLAEELGVSFAFPTQTLHVDSVAPAAEAVRRDIPETPELATLVESFGPSGARSKPEGESLTHGYFPQ